MRRTLALLSALLLAGGCSNDEKQPPPAATVPSEVTTSSTATAAPDPAVIPDDLAEIDEEYVQAVVDELFAVDAKATEIFLATRAFDEQAIKYLEAIYTEEEAARQLDTWLNTLATDSETLLPGALRNDVRRVLGVAADCVYAEVEVDFSQTTTRDVPTAVSYLGLTPKDEVDDPENLNPTAWVLFMDGFNSDGSVPENPCEGR